MAKLPVVPTADHVAMAIVAAARETGEDPIDVIQGVYGSQARPYAYLAIRKLFPALMTPTIARLVGAVTPGSLVSSASSVRSKKWWLEESFTKVVKAIESVGAPALRQTVVDGLRAAGRLPRLPRASVTADFCGDPPSGRSALDQGYRPGSGLAIERGVR